MIKKIDLLCYLCGFILIVLFTFCLIGEKENLQEVVNIDNKIKKEVKR